MAIEPAGTLILSPELTDGQWDTLFQRLELAWGTTVRLSVSQFGAILFALSPEQFAGDPSAAAEEAALIRASRPFGTLLIDDCDVPVFLPRKPGDA